MILPALSRAKERAYTITCISNLRQLGISLENYTADFQAYPYYTGAGSYWQDDLQPYSHATWEMNLVSGQATFAGRIFLCPAYARLSPLWNPSSQAYWDVLYSHNYGAYGYNWRGVWNPNTPFRLGLGGIATPSGTLAAPTRVSEILRPSNMISLSDAPLAPTVDPPGNIYGSTDFTCYQNGYDFDVMTGTTTGVMDGVWGPIGKANTRAAIKQRHSGKWVVAFCDVHVETKKTGPLLDYNNDDVLSLRTKDNLPHREVFVPSP